MVNRRPLYRHLSRDSQHRQALLRNLIDALFQHESITTTWPKAKEAQKLAEKLITLGKKNDEEARRKAQSLFYRPGLHLPKLFGELRQRYAKRPSGYTRVLRVEPKKEDQAESAILEFVDGPRDMRFAITARTIAYRMKNNLPLNDVTALNVKKVTAYRENGVAELRELVKTFAEMDTHDEKLPQKKRVYPDAGRKDRHTLRMEEMAERRSSPYW